MFRIFLTKEERLCREAADWVARLQGSASDADRARFQQWYEADPDNARTYDRLRGLYGSIGLLPPAALRRGAGAAAIPPRGRSLALAGALAALLIVVGGVIAGRLPLVPQSRAATFDLATRLGEITRLNLPDGSILVLDSDSAAHVSLDGQSRKLVLQRGRARLKVAKKARPFIVELGSGRVLASESLVDVDLLAGDANVHLLAGRALVDQGEGGIVAGNLPMRLGQRVKIGEGGIRASTSVARSSWPEGVLDFDGTPLGEAVAEANRYGKLRIRLEDPRLQALKVTGSFRAGDVAGLARSLAAAFELELRRDPAGNFLLSARADPAEAQSRKIFGGKKRVHRRNA